MESTVPFGPSAFRWLLRSGKFVDLDLRPVLTMGAGRNDTGGAFSSGSAVLIARNLALGAKHVIEQYCDMTHYSRPSEDDESVIVTRFSMFVGGGFGNDGLLSQWDVPEARGIKATDVAVLVLTPRTGPGSAGWGYPEVDLAPPEVGDEVLVCGFAEPSTTEVEHGDEPVIDWRARPVVRNATVTAVHPLKREPPGLLSFPSFEFDASVDASMSGGPIFNSSGRLCGLVASGGSSESDGLPSAGALLWPAMAHHLPGSYFGKHDPQYPLYRAAKDGVFKTRNLERVKVVFKGNGTVDRVHLLKPK